MQGSRRRTSEQSQRAALAAGMSIDALVGLRGTDRVLLALQAGQGVDRATSDQGPCRPKGDLLMAQWGGALPTPRRSIRIGRDCVQCSRQTWPGSGFENAPPHCLKCLDLFST